MKRKLISSLIGIALASMSVTPLQAQQKISDGVVKIGVLTDLSGAYSDLAGSGSVLAAQMAIDDFNASAKPGFKIELISADHQNKGDISANKAREWFDTEKVDVIADLVTTSTALAVMKIAGEKQDYPGLRRSFHPHHQ